MTASGDRVVGAVLGADAAQSFRVVRASDRVPAGSAVAVDDGEDVLVAPHIAFVLNNRLQSDATVEDVIAATRGVTAAMALLDGKRLAIVSASSMKPLDAVDLRTLGVVVEDGVDVIESGAGAAASGDPLQAVVNAASRLAEASTGRGLIVLSGPLTDSVPLRPARHVAATFAHLGRIGVRAKSR